MIQALQTDWVYAMHVAQINPYKKNPAFYLSTVTVEYIKFLLHEFNDQVDYLLYTLENLHKKPSILNSCRKNHI